MKKPLIALVIGACVATAGASSIDLEAARIGFDEASEICVRDDGALWGTSLCGPLIFVDPATRDAVANVADEEDHLKESGGLFVGQLPANVGIANTSLEWAGRKWAMVMWPLPESQDVRNQLLMHESWHRIQDEIGFPQTNPDNPHLDGAEGRQWLRREWRALKKALESDGDRRREAVLHALLFREHRREVLPGSARSERALEMHEGLAEYTGVTLASADSAAATARSIEIIDQYDGLGDFVRTFAYASGPAYGVLLDLAEFDWRENLGPNDDFTQLALRAYDVQLPARVATWARRFQRAYTPEGMLKEEVARASERVKVRVNFEADFIQNRVLILPLESMQMEFDPTRVHPLEPFGTVYETMTLRDVWGRVTIRSGGVLLDKSLSNARLSLPKDADHDIRETSDWSLELNDGWSIEDSKARPPNLVVTKKQP